MMGAGVRLKFGRSMVRQRKLSWDDPHAVTLMALLERGPAAKMSALLRAKPICEPARRKDDVIVS